MNRNLPASLLAAVLVASSTIPAAAAALPRANVVLPSAVSVDLAANTVTLPLFRGTAPTGTVWYIKTDVSDAAAARREGILFSPVLANAAAGAQTATGASNAFHFSGTVDFTPQRELKAGPDGAPAVAKPGSIGDDAYSPFVVEAGSHVVYNAPIVASGEHPHDVTTHTDTLDRAVAITTKDAQHATITLVLARGYTAGQPIAYISTDASDAGAATIERSTFAPRLAKATPGSIPIYVLFNGRSDVQYQGVGNALAHGGLGGEATAANAAHLASPLNVQATFPAAGYAASGYSPLWNVHAGVWTAQALKADKATRLTTPEAFEAAAAAGNVTAPDGKTFGPVGIVVDCPVVAFAAARPQ
jgi:hypothetical protein